MTEIALSEARTHFAEAIGRTRQSGEPVFVDARFSEATNARGLQSSVWMMP